MWYNKNIILNLIVIKDIHMLDKKYIGELRKSLHTYAGVRREVIKQSGDALHYSKRAIFALHRENEKEAIEKLDEAEKGLQHIIKTYKKLPAIWQEGSFKAALEEYVEAELFFQFIKGKKLGKIKKIDIPHVVYLAGLADVPGELYRYAIKAATKRDREMVNSCTVLAQDIIGELIECNLTSYLRTKSDQAKRSVQKLEIVQYELSLREDV